MSVVDMDDLNRDMKSGRLICPNGCLQPMRTIMSDVQSSWCL